MPALELASRRCRPGSRRARPSPSNKARDKVLAHHVDGGVLRRGRRSDDDGRQEPAPRARLRERESVLQVVARDAGADAAARRDAPRAGSDRDRACSPRRATAGSPTSRSARCSSAGIACSCPTARTPRSPQLTAAGEVTEFRRAAYAAVARALGLVDGGAVRRSRDASPDAGPRDMLRWKLGARAIRAARTSPSSTRSGRGIRDGGAAALASGAPVAVWIGHATWALRLGGKLVVTDPIWSTAISRRRAAARRRRASRSTAMPPIDIVLVTHDHRDHMDLPTLAQPRRRARLYIVPLGNAARLQASRTSSSSTGGRPTTLGDARDHARARASLVDADAVEPQRHAVGRLRVRGPEGTAYHSGDTAWGDHFAEIGQRFGRSTGRCCRSAATRRAGSWSRSTSIPTRRRAASTRSARATCSRCTGARSGSPTRRSASRRRGCARSGPSTGSIPRDCGSPTSASRAR